jgi:hypothetical protein
VVIWAKKSKNMQDAIDFLLAKDTVLKLLLKIWANNSFSASGFWDFGFIDLRTTSLDRFGKATFKITGRIQVFEPRIVFDLSDAEFRTIGVSRQRQAINKALATALINELDLDSLPLKQRHKYGNSLKSKE